MGDIDDKVTKAKGFLKNYIPKYSSSTLLVLFSEKKNYFAQ